MARKQKARGVGWRESRKQEVLDGAKAAQGKQRATATVKHRANQHEREDRWNNENLLVRIFCAAELLQCRPRDFRGAAKLLGRFPQLLQRRVAAARADGSLVTNRQVEVPRVKGQSVRTDELERVRFPRLVHAAQRKRVAGWIKRHEVGCRAVDGYCVDSFGQIERQPLDFRLHNGIEQEQADDDVILRDENPQVAARMIVNGCCSQTLQVASKDSLVNRHGETGY